MGRGSTPLGDFCSECRRKLGQGLKSQAQGTRRSISEISAIELGDQPVPDGYVSELSFFFKLTQEDEEKLQRLASGDQSAIEIERRDAGSAQLVFDFDRPPYEQLRQLRRRLHSSKPGSRSIQDLRKIARLFRKCFGLEGKHSFDLLYVLEYMLRLVEERFFLEVRPNLGISVSAYSAPGEGIVFSESMYMNLSRGVHKAKEIAAHEIAHWLLHSERHNFDSSPIGRLSFKAAEWEADQLAAEILVPEEIVKQFRTAGSLAMTCDLSREFCEKRITEFRNTTDEVKFSDARNFSASAAQPVSCFLSYCQESVAHSKWVRILAEELRNREITVRLDQWDVRPGMDLPRYMEESIRTSSHVLLICTPTFALRANEGRGGVGYEKSIICGEIISSSAQRAKLVPILRHGRAFKAIPSYLKSLVYLDMRNDNEFQQMVDQLSNHVNKR